MILDRLPRLLAEPPPAKPKDGGPAAKARHPQGGAPMAEFTIHSTFTRGAQCVVHLDFSPHRIAARRDLHGRSLASPPLREAPPACCAACPESPWCRSTEITAQPAWQWRRLGLVEPDGHPTRRGIIFSFFHHGEGLAVAAALEDAAYVIDDLVFDLANLRAGPRFAGEDPVFGGHLGILCARTYDRTDLPGYLEMGVPVEYGAGAAEVVREIVQHGTPVSKLQTETLRAGDIERALTEWRSVLRHIVLAPDYDWDRWRRLKALAAIHGELAAPAGLPGLPPLTGAQRRRLP